MTYILDGDKIRKPEREWANNMLIETTRSTEKALEYLQHAFEYVNPRC